MTHCRIAAFTALILLAGAAARADWSRIWSDPDELTFETSRLSLAAGQKLAIYSHSADGAIVAYFAGPADLERDAPGGQLTIHSGTAIIVSSIPAASQTVRIRVEANPAHAVLNGPLPRGALYVQAGEGAVRFGVQPETGAAPADLGGLAPGETIAPGYQWTWSEGKLQRGGALSETLIAQIGLTREQLLLRLGVDSARRERRALQRDLVLNLLRVDFTARSRTVAAPLAQSELRLLGPETVSNVTSSLSTTQSQFGVTPNSTSGNLQFPSDQSPATLLAGSARRGTRRVETTRGGQGLGTGGFSILGIPFGLGNVVGPGSLGGAARVRSPIGGAQRSQPVNPPAIRR